MEISKHEHRPHLNISSILFLKVLLPSTHDFEETTQLVKEKAALVEVAEW